MKTRLEFLIPSKKTGIVFVTLSGIMALAVLYIDSFYPLPRFDPVYSVLWYIADPAWRYWTYFSFPVLFFTDGIIPHNSLRWFHVQSWEMTLGVNLVYYYLVSSIVSYFWNIAGKHRNVIRK